MAGGVAVERQNAEGRAAEHRQAVLGHDDLVDAVTLAGHAVLDLLGRHGRIGTAVGHDAAGSAGLRQAGQNGAAVAVLQGLGVAGVVVVGMADDDALGPQIAELEQADQLVPVLLGKAGVDQDALVVIGLVKHQRAGRGVDGVGISANFLKFHHDPSCCFVRA